ncbi:hypothetical protein DOY81_001265 [Sarcophaga bullata]|nr:hypothetical protein DOY81_001265 [Sarcophaga bullata]
MRLQSSCSRHQAPDIRQQTSGNRHQTQHLAKLKLFCTGNCFSSEQ